MCVGAVVIGNAGYGMWIYHSGIPARVKLMDCHSALRAPFSDCSAAWMQADGTRRIVTAHEVPNEQAREHNTVDVHVHGDQAYVGSSSRVVALVVGIAVFGFGVALAFMTWLRRSRNA
jgi:hypothetical protein